VLLRRSPCIVQAGRTAKHEPTPWLLTRNRQAVPSPARDNISKHGVTAQTHNVPDTSSHLGLSPDLRVEIKLYRSTRFAQGPTP